MIVRAPGTKQAPSNKTSTGLAPATCRRTRKSPAQVAVPALDGYTRRVAERKLAAAGLSPLWLEEHLGRGETAEAQHGRVIRQDPPAESQVNRGSDVYVTLGKAVVSG